MSRTPRFRKVMVMLTEDLVRGLDAEAARRTTSRSLMVREACEAFLPPECQPVNDSPIEKRVEQLERLVSDLVP